MDDPTVIPSDHFNTVLWTGDGGSNRAINSGLSTVDLVWIKGRSNADDHRIGDTVRGGNPIEHLKANSSEAAVTNGTTVIKSISGGNFNVGSDGSVNGSSRTYVAWNWKADGAGSANTDGSINSVVSANTDAGFSIVTHSGAAGNGTVGHGLTKAPNFVITKAYSHADQWRVGSIQPLGSMDFTDYLKLNATTALTDESTTWVDTAPTSTVFSVGTDSATNHPGYDYVSYCFHAVDGFSRFGNFRGNGSQNGTYVYTGFSPMWVVVKNMSATYGWGMHDNVRDTINPVTAAFKTSDSEAETTVASGTGIDFLSNGFKIRYSGGNSNTDGPSC